MFDRIKLWSGLALGAVVLIGLSSIPFLLIKGVFWAADHLKLLIAVGWIAVAVDVLILLPLSLFKRLRSFTGVAIILSSWVFGLVTWLLGFMLTYVIWGGWAVFVGILLFGGGVVPIAMLATAIKGMWEPFFTLIVLLVVTFGSRIAGGFIAAAAEASN